jgi:Dolichyl-phosphate-mannose-protein mannosyltransferase
MTFKWSWVCTLLVCTLWGAWMLYSAATLPPAHDEIITLLNMRNTAVPSWTVFAPVFEHQQVFQGPLARFSDIAPMLKETDIHPPLYYHLALAWSHLGGDGLFGLRLLSWLATMGGVFGILLSARRLVGDSRGWELFWLALALASAASIAYAGANARNYAFFFLASVVLVEGLVRWIDGSIPRWASVSLLAGASVFLMWTHYFGAIAAFAAWIVALLYAPSWKGRGLWLAGVVATGLCVLPLSSWLAVHLGARAAQYSGFAGWNWETVYVGRIVIEQFMFATKSFWALPAMALVAMLLALAYARGLLWPVSDKVRLARALVLFAAVGLLALMCLFWWTDKTLRTPSGSRYGMFVGPALFLSLVLAAKGRVWLLAAPVAIGLSSWVVGSHGMPPWNSPPGLNVPLAELARGDTAVVLDKSRRGIAGRILLPAEAGWVGFATPNASRLSGVVLPPAVERVVFYAFDVEKVEPKVWDTWFDLLRDQGFTEAIPSKLWTRTTVQPD